MKTCLINLICFLCYVTAEDVPCTVRCGTGYEIEYNNEGCTCVPQTSKSASSQPSKIISSLTSPSDYSSSSRCEPQSCPKGYIWGGYGGGCGCFLACDYIMSCPYGEKWDFMECSCVRDPTIPSVGDSSLSSPNSEVDYSASSSSRCEPQSCPSGYFWGGLSGLCDCFLACDYIMSCPYGEKWDFMECNCVTDPTIPSYQDSSSSSPSSQISYSRSSPPNCTPQKCPRGYAWKGHGDLCGCYLACDYIMSCPYGEKWSSLECSCVKDPDVCNLSCPRGTSPNYRTCSCDSKSSQSSSPSCQPQPCPRGYTWNSYLCSCSLDCQIPKECSKDQVWNATECTCVDILEEPEDCAAWQVYNTATCDCECPEEPCECIDGFTYNDYYCDCLPIKPSCDRVCAATLFLDDFFCECLDRPCNKSCAQGYIFDVTNCTSCESCECSVDPDFISSEESSSPSSQCNITCPNSKFEVFEPLCNCFCPFESIECPVNMTLDIRECECITQPRCQLWQVCEPGFVFDDILCDCVKEPEPNCSAGFVYDIKTCSCICDKEEDCGSNFVWDFNTCSCVCPLGQDCDSGFIFDEDTCSCVCENQFDCQEGFQFNHQTCACACIQNADCEKDFVWDENICSCVLTPTPTCDAGFFYDEELCACVCQQNETCEGLKEFDDKVCRCVCPRTTKCEAFLNLDDCTCLSERV